MTVVASIADTVPDGNRVTLRVDNQPTESHWAWASAGRIDEITFSPALLRPGIHRLEIGDQSIKIIEFNKATVDEFGAIAWPCDADLAPDAIYQRLAVAVST